MAIEIFNRQELKFVISRDKFTQILHETSAYLQLDKHNSKGKSYRLHNLYIDTDDHALIRHSMTKPTVYKEKFRIRSYTGFEDNPVVFLEVKKRYKTITNKRRTKIPYDEALAFIATGRLPKLHDDMNPQVIRELATAFSSRPYHPKTFITYDRLAFLSRDVASDLRVTFDVAIAAQRYDAIEKTRLLDTNKVLMEVKSRNNIPLWLTDILTRHGIYKQSFSKYGRAYTGYLQSTHLPVLSSELEPIIGSKTTLPTRSVYA